MTADRDRLVALLQDAGRFTPDAAPVGAGIARGLRRRVVQRRAALAVSAAVVVVLGVGGGLAAVSQPRDVLPPAGPLPAISTPPPTAGASTSAAPAPPTITPAPPSSAPASTPSAPNTVAAGSPVTLVPGGVQLAGELVAFQVTYGAIAERLTGVFGAPVADTGVQPVDGFGCVGDPYRELRYAGGLTLSFAAVDRPEASPNDLELVAWTLEGPRSIAVLVDGLRLDSATTVGELRRTAPDGRFSVDVLDGFPDGVFTLETPDGAVRGVLSGTDDDDVINAVYAGLPCGGS